MNMLGCTVLALFLLLATGKASKTDATVTGDALNEQSEITCKCNPPCKGRDTCVTLGACYAVSSPWMNASYLGCVREDAANQTCGKSRPRGPKCCTSDLCNDVDTKDASSEVAPDMDLPVGSSSDY
ncbi:uncharacterized protein LOC100371659 [Saccoglossus kowalevskii]|uniref:Uncharacterized protein LOC100371659 n=1 Tax=Saccoglossus kowalevskii TaxID=10224 RepID=A0ABM0GJS5_SACKO|nr:PREDICTED: uncharacterized protein LOC100371659 [Saccoglossus kowalevskii]